MKKTFFFMAIGFLWFFMPIFVKAESVENENANGYEWVTEGLNYGSPSDATYTAKIYSHYKLCAVKGDQVGYDGDKYFIVTAQQANDNNFYVALLDSQQNSQNIQVLPYQSGSYNSQNILGEMYYNGSLANNGKFLWNWSFQMTSTYAQQHSVVPLFDTKEEALQYILSVPIDFNNLYYSPQIPIPDIDVYMGNDVLVPSSGQAIWNANIEIGDNSDYYIQYGYKIGYPSYIDVGFSPKTNGYLYNYYNYVSTAYVDIVGLDDLESAINQSAPSSYFTEGWQTFYNDYLTQSLLPDFGSQSNAISQQMIDSAKNYYVDYMLTQVPMYGNRLEVFARYFIIDEENDNRVVVGAWNHWSSKDGSRTKERPTNYIDNVALPGYINTNSDVDYQDNTSSFNSVGNETGMPTTIINNNYVPNYPDYPTIASYNKDNLLVSSIEKLNEVKGFFGEFNDFLTVTFVWVPDWIWALIGIGFSLSIIVFFLRML